MERSAELQDWMLRFYEAVANGDTGFIDRHFSPADEARGIGTDPGEWWEGPRVAAAWKEQMESMGGSMPLIAGAPEAYSEGPVGWVADRPILRLPGGELRVRLTAVFHREEGEWKLVQCHGSIGLPNEEPDAAEIEVHE